MSQQCPTKYDNLSLTKGRNSHRHVPHPHQVEDDKHMSHSTTIRILTIGVVTCEFYDDYEDIWDNFNIVVSVVIGGEHEDNS